MQGLVLGDLTIHAEEATAERIAFHWKGTSNSRDPYAGMRAFFGLVLAEAASRSLAVEMHFEALAHFNSSTIAALLRFLEEARGRGVRVELFYDGSLRWQAHTFEGLDVLVGADGLIRIHSLNSAPAKERVGPA